jgi:hypothetical protein
MFVQEQHWYYCYTCGLVESEGCCSVCVKVCHKGHEVAYARHGNFFCDCGAARSAQVRPRSIYVLFLLEYYCTRDYARWSNQGNNMISNMDMY